MVAAHNANLVNKNNTTKAPALVDQVKNIYYDEVEDLTYDTDKEDEARMYETIKTEIDKINDEGTLSLEEDESDSDVEGGKDGENIPLEYDNNGHPKRNRKKPKQYKSSFSGGNHEKGVLHFQVEKMDPMN